ncbi:MAG: hypothetical protein AB1353_05695 [Aquificota bacterium]|jgi:prefoldin subunit 5|nr:hypothetical protein [Aquificaceae bacterium]
MRKFLLALLFLSFFNLALAKEVPFTQEDRDRITRLEVKVEEGFKAVNQRIDDVNKRIDDLKESTQKQSDDLRTLILWGFGVLFSGMGILIGLVMWDRRTAISPVVKKTRELEDKSDRVEKVLKELAKEDPKIEQALKRAGLL